jgi:hypothetical protein
MTTHFQRQTDCASLGQQPRMRARAAVRASRWRRAMILLSAAALCVASTNVSALTPTSDELGRLDTWGDHAALLNGTVGTDLNCTLGSSAENADCDLNDEHGINDNVWIAGKVVNGLTGEHRANEPSSSPIPELPTYALILAGLGAAMYLALRRKDSV